MAVVTIENISEKAIFGAIHFLVLFCFVAGIGFLAKGNDSIVAGCGLFISMFFTLGTMLFIEFTKFVEFKSTTNSNGRGSGNENGSVSGSQNSAPSTSPV